MILGMSDPNSSKFCSDLQNSDLQNSVSADSQTSIQFWGSKHFTYYRLHLFYFVILCLIGSLILQFSPKRENQTISYIDALFNSVSISTATGVLSINPEWLSPSESILAMVLMLLGSQIFTSLVPLYVRRYVFHCQILKLEAEFRHFFADGEEGSDQKQGIMQDLKEKTDFWVARIGKKIWGRRLLKKLKQQRTRKEIQEHVLPDESDPVQRLYLEHDASVLLSRVVLVYFISIQIVGFLVLVICIQGSPANLRILELKSINPFFFSFFTAVAMFANAGLTPVDENLVPFRENWALLLWCSLLILMGNTMFAPCLRATIWILHRFSKGKTKSAYHYLLSSPRKIYTHLFPKAQTLWIVYTILAFNAVQCFFFFVLDCHSKTLQGLSPFHVSVAGIFQSVSTRSSGATVVNLADLSPPMLVLFVALMYVSVYPVYLSRQNTIVKQNLKPHAKNKTQYEQVLMQSRKLLARDSALVFAAIFLICICLSKRIHEDPLNFSVFNIIFEVISGYGNVGLSVGYSCNLNRMDQSCVDKPWSLSGKFNVLGKLLMVVVMLLGRHRGLPEDIDVAVTMPQQMAPYDGATFMPLFPLLPAPLVPNIQRSVSMPITKRMTEV